MKLTFRLKDVSMSVNIFTFAPTPSQNGISENFSGRKRPTKARASGARESHDTAPRRGDDPRRPPPRRHLHRHPLQKRPQETMASSSPVPERNRRAGKLSRFSRVLTEVAGPSPGRRMGQVSRACDASGAADKSGLVPRSPRPGVSLPAAITLQTMGQGSLPGAS